MVGMSKVINMSIPTVKPLSAKPGYNSRWGWDKDENGESHFAKRLRRQTDPQDNQAPQSGHVKSFDNPAFNILTGSTNFIVSEIASKSTKT
jgi:hypothetical protein